jgi:LmbE family N-acetylglucosaminyl deacetylase
LTQEGGILAIGAHAADMELTCGMVVARYVREGYPATFLHLTLGERGHGRLSPQAYAQEKRESAIRCAASLGAQVRFLDYPDGEVPDDEKVRLEVAAVIRELRPRVVVTTWQGSIHRDHRRTHHIVVDARFLAGLKGVDLPLPPVWVPHLWFAENWEDMEGFEPDLYLDTTAEYARWDEAMHAYAIWRDPSAGGFPYRQYYTALSRVRGALARCEHAVAFLRSRDSRVYRPSQLPT